MDGDWWWIISLSLEMHYGKHTHNCVWIKTFNFKLFSVIFTDEPNGTNAREFPLIDQRKKKQYVSLKTTESIEETNLLSQ